MPLPPPATIGLLELSLVVGMSPRQQREALERFGSARAALDALGRRPEVPLVDRALAWASRASERHLIALGEDRYPPLLREISDPPLVLYAEGRIELLASTCFAIVGARNASDQGRTDARAFARRLSDAGLCIASGLAHGVDAAAHEGGLEGASSSIAVTGTGIDLVYPKQNDVLARRLVESGCVVTEYALGMPPIAGNFPRRNRLISGLARGVLVVQANDRSGSLSTARFAAEQGRDVFALPGSIHSSLAKGCHKLIKDGAKLVETAADILVELGMQADAQVATPRRYHPLLAAMGHDPVSVDQIMRRTGLAAAAIGAQLSLLEIDGRVDALPGGRFQRIDGVG